MKRTIISLCLTMTCLMVLAACNQQAPSIGVLDEAAAFRDNQAAKAAMEFLKQKSAPLQAEAEKAYKAMQAEENEKTSAAYREAMGKLQSVMSAEQQRVVAMLSEKFNKVIDDYRASKGLTLVVDKKSVLSMDDSVEVTQDIIDAMDKLELDFAAKAEVSENPAATVEQKAAAKKDEEKKAE